MSATAVFCFRIPVESLKGMRATFWHTSLSLEQTSSSERFESDIVGVTLAESPGFFESLRSMTGGLPSDASNNIQEGIEGRRALFFAAKWASLCYKNAPLSGVL